MSSITVLPGAPINVVVQGNVPTIVSPTGVTVAPGQGGSVGPVGPAGPIDSVVVFTRQNDLSVVTGKTRMYIEGPRKIYKIRASVGTPSQGSSVVASIFLNGTTLSTLTIPPSTTPNQCWPVPPRRTTARTICGNAPWSPPPSPAPCAQPPSTGPTSATWSTA